MRESLEATYLSPTTANADAMVASATAYTGAAEKMREHGEVTQLHE